MKKKNGFAVLILTLAFTVTAFTGCGNTTAADSSLIESSILQTTALSDTGTLVLKVNPEIAVHYDEKGIVTSVEGINDDGKKLITDDSAYVGKECQEVIRSLVSEINDAGFFVEEVEGQKKTITIEIEKGSVMPSDQFLNNIVTQVRDYVGEMHLASPVDLEGETDYGMTNYQDTDYGPDNDGVTDYNDTDYGPNNDGVTDYNDTDYGPNNDGVTDYNDTDYGPNNDGVTDYNDTDYGPNNDGVTDYNDTDYGPNNDGVTDYSSTNYGSTNYDDNGTTNYEGNTNYDDGDSSYGH
ncbi:MAG: anti-sigma-I factor RsgI family protein [Candidatus Merdivicinus sp.]|jgi:hypothetical protein